MATSSIGVRDLRQNLSKHLTRVKAGESLVVTERGEEVARLIPSGPSVDVYAELAARFGATVPQRRLTDILAELDLPSSAAGTADAFLAEGRRERL